MNQIKQSKVRVAEVALNLVRNVVPAKKEETIKVEPGPVINFDTKES